MITPKDQLLNGAVVLSGLSTDTKPDVKNGSRYTEIDTGKEYLYSEDDSTWYEQPAAGPSVTVVPLPVAENGTYTAPEGQAYNPVIVDVASAPVMPEHGVYFIDYDGELVSAWESADVADKTALPDNPTHDGLVAQGWNWDLQHIKDYISAYENANVYVGQMYKTVSGLTEIDITVTKVTDLTVTCNMVGNKDWGDGTEDALTSHTYTEYGDYTITCDGTSIPAGTDTAGGLFGSTLNNVNRFWCRAIRIGEDVTSIGNYAFYSCTSLTSVTIPQGFTSIGSNAFENCYTLTSVTIPQGVTSISDGSFNNCHTLTSVTIPQGVTSIGPSAFGYCYLLTSVTIPQGVTSIERLMFYSCRALTSVTIPQGVTSFGNSVFYSCTSLTSVTIPQGVTSFGNSVFESCVTITEYDFTSAAAVPNILSTQVFKYINGLCKIIVPDALYNEWIVATNWATYANYIYKASEVSD